MTKSKTPFFSMGAKGTVGGVLTSQKGSGDTILRRTPVPTDPYSLRQAYQRWDYQDYAHLWTLETEASKQTYRTRASRYHLTGFSLWMKEHLRDLPDLACRLHLDEPTGQSFKDSSKQGNDGIGFGTIPTTGIIDLSRFFDGVNDKVTITHNSTIELIDEFSFDFFVYPYTLAGDYMTIISKYNAGVDGVGIYHQGPPNNWLNFRIRGTFGDQEVIGSALVALIWQHIVVTFKSGQQRIIKDGVIDAAAGWVGTITPNAKDLYLAVYGPWGNPYHGLIDHFCLYNRALSITEALRHSERRYPA